VRTMLDGKGILGEDDFDRVAAEVPARHPATSSPVGPRPGDRAHPRRARSR
jgi:hypothetical protein